MGLLHAWRVQKVVSDATIAFNRGDLTFTVDIDIDTRARVTARMVRKEIDLITRRVEPQGWRLIEYGPFLNSIEMHFMRAPR
ncbi:hypothetical protein SAMN05421504_101326 [Amycolatopsis xylanica]|uniref:Uncharacterized protein n=1 Tax=Amycolatopsis xylanica TaxID=589385 RepID=A0A1H2SSC6_9PSEU|nr:hypothetical protein [Amycolatopsis xylanica]SDW34563.1 hypothetical protein SAMN05421504_101326 [Amycolatopsis xylanica]